jgi:hypothetical protein
VTGGDVEEHQLVGALGVVSAGDLHRVAGVAQVQEVHALYDPALLNVQARYDSLGQHPAFSEDAAF